MSGQITEVFVTFANAAPSPGCFLVGKYCNNGVYVWANRGEGEPVTDLTVIYGDAEIPEGFTKVEGNLQKNTTGKQAVHLCVKIGGENVETDAFVELKSAQKYVEGGFVKIKRALNPDVGVSREYIVYQTRLAKRKVDTSDYDVGDKCDVLDGSTWRTAAVLQTRVQDGNKEIYIQFDGWEANWNVWIKITSPKLAPINAKTKGAWTGGRPKPAFDLSEAENVEEFRTAKAALQELVDGEYQVSMEEFLANDHKKFVLKVQKASIPDEIIDEIEDFLKMTAALYAKCVRQCEGDLSADLCKALLCFMSPELSFFKTHGVDREATIDEGKFATRNSQTPPLASAHLINIVNHFGAEGGFDAIVQRFSDFVNPETKSVCSFVTVATLLKTVSNMKDILRKSFAQSFAQQVNMENLIIVGMENVTDVELKHFSLDFIQGLIGNVERFMRLTESADRIAQFIETVNLNIALRLLKAQVLEKKINGMTSLERIVKSVDMKDNEDFEPHDTEAAASPAYRNPSTYAVARYGAAAKPKEAPIKAAQYLTPDLLVQWIDQKEVLQTVLGRNQHPQVVKRSPILLKFLARQKKLSSRHIDLLWSIASGNAHEDLVRIVYETFADIAEDLNVDQLGFLFDRIKQKPLDQYEEFDMTYVKGFTLNAVKATGGSNWYGLDLFWQMTQISTMSSELREAAIKTLVELLALSLFESQREVYQAKCMKAIAGAADAGFFSCLGLLRSVGSADEKSASAVIDLVLAGAAKYSAASQKSKGPDDDADASYVAGLTHQQCINSILDFVEFKMVNSGLTPSSSQVTQLWNVFIIGALGPLDRVLVLNWLRSLAAPSQEVKSAGLPDNITEAIFGLLSQEHEDSSGKSIPHTVEWFSCYQMYFCQINCGQRGALLDCDLQFLDVTNFAELTAMDTLWPFIFSSEKTVSDGAAHFYSSLHIRLDFRYTSPEKKEVFETFVSACMDKLQALSADDLASNMQNLSLEEKTADDLVSKMQNLSLEEKTADQHFKVGVVVNMLLQFLDRVHSGEGNKRPLFQTGEKISSFYKSSKGKKYPCTIQGRNPDGTYDLLYDDGDKDHKAPESNLHERDGKVRVPRVSATDVSTFTHPHNVLAANSAYFDLFFKLLGYGSAGAAVWTVLSRLPTNVSLKNSIKSLAGKESVDWKAVLSAESLIKLLYTLQIVKKNVMAEDPLPPAEDGDAQAPQLVRASSVEHPMHMQEWSRTFTDTGGFAHILSIFMTIDTKQIFSSDLSVQCIALILKLVDHFLTGNIYSTGVEGQTIFGSVDAPALLTRLLSVLRNAISHNDASSELASSLGSLVNSVLLCIQALIRASPDLLASIYTFEHWGEILTKGFVECPSEPVRTSLAAALSDMCSDISTEHKGHRTPREFFVPLLLKQLPSLDTAAEDKYCTELLGTLGDLLQSSNAPSDDVNTASLAKDLTQLIQNHPFKELTEKDHDSVFCSILNLVASLVEKNDSLKALLAKPGDSKKESLVEHIIHCLFDLPGTNFTGNDAPSPPKCKSSAARDAAFKVLSSICKNNASSTLTVMDHISPNHLVSHSGGKHDNKNKDAWSFEVKLADKSSAFAAQDYRGLVNLGCICYMNAANQQFFMIPKFRANVLAIDQYDDPDMSKSTIYNFQYLMGYLQESRLQAINPRPFTNVWTNEFGEPIQVGKQEDSHGYVNSLCDRLNEMVKNTPHQHAVTDVFGGVLQHQMIGSGECKHFRVREENFFNIQVDIKQKKDLVESLHAYIQGENMDGVRCDACDKKVTLSKRAVIKKLPPTLVIQLKRFTLDYTTFQSVKLNDRLEFPFELDMKPYTAEALTSPEQLQAWAETKVLIEQYEAQQALAKATANEGKSEAKSEGKSKEGDGEAKAAPAPVVEAKEKEDIKPVTHPKEYYQYKLKGVVVHTGTVNAGHYYSFIQERLPETPELEKWYKFNDASVTPFDPANLEAETFGGGGGPKSWGGCANGYLLFYDRMAYAKKVDPSDLTADGKPISFEAAAHVASFANKMSAVTKKSRARARLPPRIFHKIWEGNLTYWRDKNVFDPQYFEFLWDLVSAAPKNFLNQDVALADVDMNVPSYPRDAITRVATRFFMVTLCRAKNKASLNQWVGALKRLYKDNVASCAWLLNKFQEQRSRWAFDGLFNNPDQTCRNAVADLLMIAFSTVSPLEQGSYAQEGKSDQGDNERALEGADFRIDSRGFCVGFADFLWKNMLVFASRHPKIWNNFFRVLEHFASLGSVEKAYLNQYNLVPKLIDIYLGPKSPHPELNPTATLSRTGFRLRMKNPDCTWLFKFLAVMTQEGLSAVSEMGQTMLTCEPFLESFVAEGNRAISAQGVCTIATLLCADLKMNKQLADIMYNGMVARAHDQIRPYFRVIHAVCSIEDEHQAQRVSDFMSMIATVLSKQRSFWKVVDFCADHVIRLAKNIPAVRSWLSEHADLVDFLLVWFESHPTSAGIQNDAPRLQAGTATLLYEQKGVMYTQSSSKYPYHLKIADKVAALEAIRDNTELSSARAEDSDIELATRQFEVHDRIDVLDDQNNWLECQIIEKRRGGMVRVHYVGYKAMYDEDVHEHSPRIAALHTFTSPKKPKRT